MIRCNSIIHENQSVVKGAVKSVEKQEIVKIRPPRHRGIEPSRGDRIADLDSF